MVTARPAKLIGVRGSWKTIPAAVMVTTSLKIPQILSVTTEVRCKSANSEDVIRKASVPGNTRIQKLEKTPLASASVARPSTSFTGPSMGMAIKMRVRNIIGARKKMLLKGLLVAGFRRSRICVKAHRKPEKNAAAITSMKPMASNAASPATIIMTPMVMVAIIRTSLREGDSRRKRKANMRTNAREEDLHIARKIY